jgi:hypothetical protein
VNTAFVVSVVVCGAAAWVVYLVGRACDRDVDALLRHYEEIGGDELQEPPGPGPR